MRNRLGWLAAGLLAGLVLLSGCASTAPVLASSDWTLVWEDDFNGRQLDTERWNFRLGNGFYDSYDNWVPGWGNNELQYYTNRPENIYLRDGALVLEAREEAFEGEAAGSTSAFRFTSGAVTTEDTFAQTYGRFEIRARLPQGRGLWPAFWLLPVDTEYGPWAASGEIDVMEGWGSRPIHVSQAAHFGGEWPANRYAHNEYLLPDGLTTSDWIVYAIEWEPGQIRWYVNEEEVWVLERWFTGSSMNPDTYPAPFDQDFYMLMNLAVGGHFDGNPNQSTEFPARFEIDYIRVYELTGRPYREPVYPALDRDPRPEDWREPTKDGNEVYNAGFTEDDPDVPGIDGVPGTDHWVYLQLPQFMGEGELSIEDVDGTNFARIDVSQGGNAPYSVQLIQYLPVMRGYRYQVSFDAFADEPRDIQMKINGDEEQQWRTYSGIEAPSLSTEPDRYVYFFEMSELSDPEARLEFNVGMDTGTVWIGNISVEIVD